MQPTPNGHLHIGHGGGTYLRADVWARMLRVRSHDVVVLCGSDVYENWVIAEAQRIGRSPEETCSLYHTANHKALGLLAIDFDAWVNPLDSPHQTAYTETHERVFKMLRQSGSVAVETEKIPFVVSTGEPAVGAWLAGRCPRCKADAQGSSCVRCGTHFQPEDLVVPRSRMRDDLIEWRTMQNWFIRARDISLALQSVEAVNLSEPVMMAAEEYLRQAGGRIRVSGPNNWGIRTRLLPPRSTLANPYYLYSYYCGEIYRHQQKLHVNPFNPNSDVRTIGVFGSDNTIPGVVAPHVFTQALPEHFTPFDIVVVNGMLNFEGRKCSTSKRHGIWLGELLRDSPVTADELRWTLAQAPLDEGAADLSLESLVSSANMFRRSVADVSRHLDALIGNSLAWTSSLERQWANEFAYEPGCTSVATMAADLRSILGRVSHGCEPATMLLLCLLSAPIVPGLAASMWRRLGFDGDVSVDVARHNVGSVRASERTERSLVGRGELQLSELLPYVHRGV